MLISGAVVCMRLTRGRCDHSSLSPCDHRICRSTVSRSPVLTRDGICVPPTVIDLPYRVSGSTLTAVGRSQLLARWPGTHSQILSGIQRAAQTVLSVCLKRTCSCDISASSAFRVLNDNALYKFTHSLTDDLDQCVAVRAEWLQSLSSSKTDSRCIKMMISFNNTINERSKSMYTSFCES